jgi:hypothetical protein
MNISAMHKVCLHLLLNSCSVKPWCINFTCHFIIATTQIGFRVFKYEFDMKGFWGSIPDVRKRFFFTPQRLDRL